MPTYAILGATGNVGLSLLKVLTQNTSNNSTDEATPSTIKIKAYVRSKSKLLSLYPTAATHPDVTIIQGQLQDPTTLETTLRDADAVFLTLATVNNTPGCTIAQESAGYTVRALERLKSQTGDSYKPPKLIVLSSATVSKTMWREPGMPDLAHTILSLAASYIYADLSKAEAYLRGYEQSDRERLFRVSFVKPGGLIPGEQKGHVLNTERSFTFTSFSDLAGGMVEIAGDGGGKGATGESGGNATSWEWDGKDVSVNSAAEGGAKMDFWTGVTLPWFIVCGIAAHVKGRLMGYPCDFSA